MDKPTTSRSSRFTFPNLPDLPPKHLMKPASLLSRVTHPFPVLRKGWLIGTIGAPQGRGSLRESARNPNREATVGSPTLQRMEGMAPSRNSSSATGGDEEDSGCLREIFHDLGNHLLDLLLLAGQQLNGFLRKVLH